LEIYFHKNVEGALLITDENTPVMVFFKHY